MVNSAVKNTNTPSSAHAFLYTQFNKWVNIVCSVNINNTNPNTGTLTSMFILFLLSKLFLISYYHHAYKDPCTYIVLNDYTFFRI